MTCEHYIEMISAGIDDELTDVEVTELEDHLRTCSECRKLQSRVQNQNAEMSDKGVPPMPETLRANIRQKLMLTKPKPHAHIWYVDDPFRMIIPAKKENKPLVMSPWGRAI
ncbi:zf-HC2 domain-containing protein [bacterium]|nr:zf-HC2 domain-containing protein [bacterium]